MMEDNQGAIALVKNPIGHSRTKHIDIRFQLINLKYCPTEEMLADLLTKPLPKVLFETLRLLLGMERI